MNLFQSDSTAVSTAGDADLEATQATGYGVPKTPYQVIKRLPADATPAQQDSAVQANFKVEHTHLSTRPDTLYMPGERPVDTKIDPCAPLYYKSTFLAKDTVPCTTADNERFGVAGDPMPYTVRGDDIITSLLLGCFFLAMIAFAKSRRFILLQAKRLFYEPNALTTEVNETTGEIRFQFFLTLQTCLLLAIISFIYVQQRVSDTFVLQSQYQLIFILCGCYALYFCFRMLAYWLVNNVFFGRKKSIRWLKLLLFATSAEGTALFPLAMLQSYFDLPIQNAIIYVAAVIIIVKLLLLYKCKVAFFNQKGGFVQIILYFCALEMTPFIALWGVTAMIVDYLTITI